MRVFINKNYLNRPVNNKEIAFRKETRSFTLETKYLAVYGKCIILSLFLLFVSCDSLNNKYVFLIVQDGYFVIKKICYKENENNIKIIKEIRFNNKIDNMIQNGNYFFITSRNKISKYDYNFNLIIEKNIEEGQIFGLGLNKTIPIITTQNCIIFLNENFDVLDKKIINKFSNFNDKSHIVNNEIIIVEHMIFLVKKELISELNNKNITQKYSFEIVYCSLNRLKDNTIYFENLFFNNGNSIVCWGEPGKKKFNIYLNRSNNIDSLYIWDYKNKMKINQDVYQRDVINNCDQKYNYGLRIVNINAQYPYWALLEDLDTKSLNKNYYVSKINIKYSTIKDNPKKKLLSYKNIIKLDYKLSYYSNSKCLLYIKDNNPILIFDNKSVCFITNKLFSNSIIRKNLKNIIESNINYFFCIDQ